MPDSIQPFPDPRSADPIQANIEALRAIFPEAVAEGRVDLDVLKQLLGAAADDTKERYGLNWLGKRHARQLALTPTTGTLLPDRETSVDWDTTKHRLLEGDNLEVLKILQKSFSRKVKAIYIDPPYNTGNNLIYPNDYSDGMKTYMELTGQAEGGERLTTNPESGGRFHTNWLSMIYPRLKLARTLLADDGVLIATIDNSEVNQLGVVLREVFEEGNFEHVCVPIVHNPRGQQGKNFSFVQEYAFFVFPTGITVIDKRMIEVGEVVWSPLRNWGGESLRTDARTCFYPIIVRNEKIVGFGDVPPDDFYPKGQTERQKDGAAFIWPIDQSGIERKWRFALESAKSLPSHWLRVKPTKLGFDIEIGKEDGTQRTVFWDDKRYDANKYGAQLVARIVPGSPFTYPKSLWAVYDCLLAAVRTDEAAIVLDFFAGSGTTGHAVMQINKDLGGNRRFILVQFPEETEDKKFPTIFDVTAARIKAAGKAIKSEAKQEKKEPGDTGVRIFRLAQSNIQAWNTAPTDLQVALRASIDHIVPGRKDEDVLFEVLLKLGYDPCTSVEAVRAKTHTVYVVDGGKLFVCLGTRLKPVDIDLIANKIIATWEASGMSPDVRIIFNDADFTDDVTKANIVAILHQAGITRVSSV